MKNGNIKSPLPAFAAAMRHLRPYVSVFFFLLLAAAYGFIVLRINLLSNAPISDSDVQAQTKSSPTPHIDANAAKQLQTLKDNSVNVQTLFEQSRQNPFQE